MSAHDAPGAAAVTDAPYEALAEFAEAELAAVRDGDLDAAAAAQARGAALMAALPARPPAHARAHLERTAAARRAVDAALVVARAEVGNELERLGRGRRAARSYGAVAPPRHGLDQPA